MKGLRLLIMGVAVFWGCSLFGQAKLSMQITGFPAHINVDSNGPAINTFIQITNNGDKAFTGVVSLAYTVNNTFYTGDDQGPLSFPHTTLSLPVDSSVQKALTIYTNQPAFQTIGTSVVVIWPLSLSALTYDSISYSVQIDSNLTSGFGPLAETKVSVFVNQQQLFIQTAGVNYFRHVQIYNLQGQLLVDQNLSSSTALNIGKYSAECYLVELTFIDNSQKVYKVINSGSK